jgi:hypothetical protein
LIEGLAAGANKSRIEELSIKWGCNDDDATIYAERVGCIIERDGDMWCAHKTDFINLQESPAGFGSTKLEAMADLCEKLGYAPSKMWGPTFKSLLKISVAENKSGGT